MTADKQKVLDRLVKIRRHMESANQIGSEAEAQAFAGMMQRLLAEHQLEMTDIEFAAHQESDPVGTHFIDYNKYPEVELKGSRREWIESLAAIVAPAHFCHFLIHPNSSRITLVGRKRNCEVAEYMLMTLQRLIETMSYEAYYTYRLAQQGTANTAHTNRRLTRRRAPARNPAVAAVSSSGTSAPRKASDRAGSAGSPAGSSSVTKKNATGWPEPSATTRARRSCG